MNIQKEREFTRLNIIVEGYTEESFVNNVLAPHLASYSVSANCLPLNGISTYAKIEAFVCRMLKSDKSAFLTTIIDLYGLPNKFPGYRDAKECNSGGEKAGLIAERWLEHLTDRKAKDKALINQLDANKFIPYIQAYEFEALLFSDPKALGEALADINDGYAQILAITETFSSSPEEINDNPQTAPSKRLFGIYGKAYDKVVYGSLIAEEIGLEKIRKKCPHFNQWVARLEGLSQNSQD